MGAYGMSYIAWRKAQFRCLPVCKHVHTLLKNSFKLKKHLSSC